MFPDELVEFRNAHSRDRRCTGLGWEFIGALWNDTLSDLAGRVKVETVWREGTDAVILIEDTETGTRCYAAYGSLNCVPHP